VKTSCPPAENINETPARELPTEVKKIIVHNSGSSFTTVLGTTSHRNVCTYMKSCMEKDPKLLLIDCKILLAN